MKCKQCPTFHTPCYLLNNVRLEIFANRGHVYTLLTKLHLYFSTNTHPVEHRIKGAVSPRYAVMFCVVPLLATDELVNLEDVESIRLLPQCVNDPFFTIGVLLLAIERYSRGWYC